MDSALVANISTISQTLEDIVSSRLKVSLFSDMRARPLRHMNWKPRSEDIFAIL